MFEFVRTHKKILQFVLILLVFPSFVLFGVEGYTRMNDRGPVVASVDGHDIRQSEWDAAHKNQVDRLREQMPGLDPKLLDSPQARYETLDGLVRDRVIAAAARHSRLLVSDERLMAALQADPALAAFRGPDGRVDLERLKQALARQGMTPQMYDEQVRADMATRQVLVGIGGTGLAGQSPAGVALGAFFEQREIQVARIDAAELAATVTPTDAEIEAFYKANAPLFQSTEQAAIEYLVLDLETLKKSVQVSEADLRTYFEQNVAKPAGSEERRASHILIAAPKDAPAAERQAARARAQALLDTLRKSPNQFAELARKNSKDAGSAAKGGDLDFFARGAMPKPFEDAAFALKKGEFADVVETELGYHVLRLTDIKQPKQRTFEEAKPQLEAQLRQQQAQRKFAETADAFSNAVYEQSDSLKGVAERFKLEIRTAAGVSRQPAAGATGALANPKFLSSLFSSDSLEKKRNTEAVEIAPGVMVAGRVTQYQPAATLPLEAVKPQVVARLKASRGAELARQQGEQLLKAAQSAKADPAAPKLGAAQVVSRRKADNQPREVVEAALRADPASLPAYVGVDLGAKGYALVKVTRSIPREAPAEAAAKAEQQQYNQWWTQAEMLAYYELLKDRFKVKIKVPAPGAAAAAKAS